MTIEKNVAETDILKFIDNAFCKAKAFGYGTTQQSEEMEGAINALMNYLEETDMSHDQWMEAEPLANDLIRISEYQGFKRGFNIALRIMIAGLDYH